MATFNAIHQIAAGSTAAQAPASGPTLLRRLQIALTVRRQRKALLSLDDRMLADVGLSQADVYREAHRPFMDLPNLPGRNSW